MKNMTCLLTAVCGVFVGTLVLARPALAMTNDESAQTLKLKELVLPIYPDSVKLEGLTSGIVTAIVSHNPAGEVTDLLVIDSTNPRFTEAVREAVKHWKFSPEANVGAAQAPAVRFFFSSRGVVSFQSPGLTEMETRIPAPETVLLPTFGSLDAAPKALEQPMPVFPASLRGRVSTGTATVSFCVDENGRARAAVVTQATAAEFAEAARTAVEHWRFEVPRQNGRPVVAMEKWNFRFGGPTGS